MMSPSLLPTADPLADGITCTVDDSAKAAALLCAEQPRLRRLLHRLLGLRATASELDDLLQDVLLKAWRRRATFHGDARLSTWLARIAINAASDHVRRRQRRRRLFGWMLPPEVAAGAPADGDGRGEHLRRALQRLRHTDREVLVLRYLEGRPIDELMALLGQGRAAIDARLSRARSRLRAALTAAEER